MRPRPPRRLSRHATRTGTAAPPPRPRPRAASPRPSSWPSSRWRSASTDRASCSITRARHPPSAPVTLAWRRRTASGSAGWCGRSTCTPSADDRPAWTSTGTGAPPARSPGMRPRAELGVAVAILAALAVAAAMLGSRRARNADSDPRRSTYLAGPSGASAWAEALGRLGVRVDRYRRPALSLGDVNREGVFAVIGPAQRLDAREAAHLSALGGDLLLAGEGADPAMACLGYRVSTRWSDPAALKAPPGAEQRPMPRARAELVRHLATTIVDSSDVYDGRRVTCGVPSPIGVDTLLRTINDRPVAIRVDYAGGRTVTLVADDGLFRNSILRQTAAGPIMLGLVTPRYQRVIV